MRNLTIALPLLLLAAAGCAGNASRDAGRAEERISWPQAPEQTRITYIRTISTPRDIGADRGVLSRLAEVVLGPRIDELIRPYGVATDPDGRLLVVDTAFKRVHVFDLKNSKYSVIEAADPEFASPIAVASDAGGGIYVSDSTLNVVFAFGKKGNLLFKIKGLAKPTGLAVNRKDRLLYVADTGANDVKVFDLAGKPVRTIGRFGSGKGEFNSPVDIVVNADGDLYVTDTMNYRIQAFDKNGDFKTMFGRHGDGTGDFGRPKGLALDHAGNIYVVDAIFDTVQIFDAEGKFLLNFGAIGDAHGNFWMPTGLHIDETDTIYVADSYNKRVQVFKYVGDN